MIDLSELDRALYRAVNLGENFQPTDDVLEDWSPREGPFAVILWLPVDRARYGRGRLFGYGVGLTMLDAKMAAKRDLALAVCSPPLPSLRVVP